MHTIASGRASVMQPGNIFNVTLAKEFRKETDVC